MGGSVQTQNGHSVSCLCPGPQCINQQWKGQKQVGIKRPKGKKVGAKGSTAQRREGTLKLMLQARNRKKTPVFLYSWRKREGKARGSDSPGEVLWNAVSLPISAPLHSFAHPPQPGGTYKLDVTENRYWQLWIKNYCFLKNHKVELDKEWNFLYPVFLNTKKLRHFQDLLLWEGNLIPKGQSVPKDKPQASNLKLRSFSSLYPLSLFQETSVTL